MMKKYGRQFITFPDVTVMVIIFAVMLGFTIPNLYDWRIWAAIGVGMMTYAISEYMIHRFLFHIKKPKNPFLLKIIKRLHYDHHVDPDDVKLLFLPLWFSLPNFIILVLICYAITSNLNLTMGFATGVIGYFLFYEWKHFVAHKPIQPVTKMGKQIKKSHLWHHYKNENYWFGVTHRAVDKTMGTYRDHKKVEKSDTARDLEKRA
nr:sterol desaturase family protein [Virgibacillus chiguensis]